MAKEIIYTYASYTLAPYGVFLDESTQLNKADQKCKYLFSNSDDSMFSARYSLATLEHYRGVTLSLKGGCEEYNFTSKFETIEAIVCNPPPSLLFLLGEGLSLLPNFQKGEARQCLNFKR